MFDFNEFNVQSFALFFLKPSLINIDCLLGFASAVDDVDVEHKASIAAGAIDDGDPTGDSTVDIVFILMLL